MGNIFLGHFLCFIDTCIISIEETTSSLYTVAQWHYLASYTLDNIGSGKVL